MNWSHAPPNIVLQFQWLAQPDVPDTQKGYSNVQAIDITFPIRSFHVKIFSCNCGNMAVFLCVHNIADGILRQSKKLTQV